MNVSAVSSHRGDCGDAQFPATEIGSGAAGNSDDRVTILTGSSMQTTVLAGVIANPLGRGLPRFPACLRLRQNRRHALSCKCWQGLGGLFSKLHGRGRQSTCRIVRAGDSTGVTLWPLNLYCEPLESPDEPVRSRSSRTLRSPETDQALAKWHYTFFVEWLSLPLPEKERDVALYRMGNPGPGKTIRELGEAAIPPLVRAEERRFFIQDLTFIQAML